MREEENKRTSQGSKRFFQKRWAFPAIYIASAAIILTAVLWYQASNNNVAKQDEYNYNATDIAGKNTNPPAMEVNGALENVKWPVMTPESATIQKQFYDVNASTEEQEAALVSYGDSFQPNTGIDIIVRNSETFDVVAALSGKVLDVREDQFLGNVIEIEHDNGVVTQYSSLKDMNVEVGTEVKQGQAIAKAGQSVLNQEAGVHVHFEIRKDNHPVNPIDFFDKPVSSVQVPVEKPADDKEAVEDQTTEEGTESAPSNNKVDEGAGTSDDEEKTDQPANEKKSTES